MLFSSNSVSPSTVAHRIAAPVPVDQPTQSGFVSPEALGLVDIVDGRTQPHWVERTHQAAHFWERLSLRSTKSAPLVRMLESRRRNYRALSEPGGYSPVADSLYALSLSSGGRSLLNEVMPPLVERVGVERLLISGAELLPADPRSHFSLPAQRVESLDDIVRIGEVLPSSQCAFWLGTLLERSDNPEMREFGGALREQATGMSVTFLTLNVLGIPGIKFWETARRYDRITKHLNERGADVVSLQETFLKPARRIVEGSALPYKAPAEKPYGYLGAHGLQALSRHKILHSEFFPFSDTQGIEHVVNKGALLTRIELPNGRKLDVWHMHVLARTVFSGSAVGSVQARQIEQAVGWQAQKREEGIPQITMGDMNIDQRTPEHRLLGSAFGEDLYRAHFSGRVGVSEYPEDVREEFEGYTFDPATNPRTNKFPSYFGTTSARERIDYIFAAGFDVRTLALSARRCFMGGDRRLPASDHYGVEIDLVETSW